MSRGSWWLWTPLTLIVWIKTVLFKYLLLFSFPFKNDPMYVVLYYIFEYPRKLYIAVQHSVIVSNSLLVWVHINQKLKWFTLNSRYLFFFKKSSTKLDSKKNYKILCGLSNVCDYILQRYTLLEVLTLMAKTYCWTTTNCENKWQRETIKFWSTWANVSSVKMT